MEDFANQHSNHFVRVSDDFILHIYKQKMYEEAYSDIMSIITSNEPLASDGADEYLRSIVNQNVFAHNPTNTQHKKDTFPGPMAVQLARKHLQRIQDLEYFITEKSDGIRVLFLTLHMKNFPRWKSEDGSIFSFVDNCALETTVSYLLNHPDTPQPLRMKLQNDDDTCMLNVNVEEVDPNLSLRDKKKKCIVTMKRGNQEDLVSSRIIYDEGWSFSYICDRTFKFYFCMEEFVFPTLESLKNKWVKHPHIQNVVLLDGEVIENLKEKRYNLTIYDLITCCSSIPIQKNTPIPQYNLKIHSFTNVSMDIRRKAITQNVIEPHYFYYKKCLQKSSPVSLQILAKHFYDKERLMEVFNCIQMDQTTGAYLYKYYNRNDGLIFTPKSEIYYRFTPSSNPFLLKWKWPDKLTIDFKIIYDVDNADPAEQRYKLYYNLNSNPIFYKSVILDGVSEDTKQFSMNNSVIAECSYSQEEGRWNTHMIRNDKTSANAFKTISSTLENVLENVTIDDLKRSCLKKQASIMTEEQLELQVEFERQLAEWDIFAYFKINQRRNKIFLEFSAPAKLTGSDMDSWKTYQNIEEYLGPNMERGTELINLMGKYLMESSETYSSIYAACVFIPSEGRWKIVSIVKDQNVDCSCNNLLETLERMITLNYKLQLEHKKQIHYKSQDDPLYFSSTTTISTTTNNTNTSSTANNFTTKANTRPSYSLTVSNGMNDDGYEPKAKKQRM